jgi:dTDP-4-dehydrorhamnose 3,5-epimerase
MVTFWAGMGCVGQFKRMRIEKTAIAGVLLLEPRVFGDARGFFMESFNQQAFDEAVGEPVTFVQDNHSRSARGVLRGLHFQHPPHAQGKLVRVVAGAVFDSPWTSAPAAPRSAAGSALN